MMKRNGLVFSVVLVLCFTTLVLAGCSKKKSGQVQKTAKLVYVNWEEGVDYTHLAQAVLEEKMGYKVDITAADVAPAYVSVAQGDQDAFMETWLPVTHEEYVKRYQDDIIQLGTVYETTRLGLVVPKYVYDAGVHSISDLKKPEFAKKFNYTITGIDAGAGIMRTTEQNIMPQYGLDADGYKLLSSSGPAMLSALKESVESNSWIVVTGWQPHSMFGYFDLKFLNEDKEPAVWQSGNIYIYGRKNLKEDKPELAAFLSKMYLTNDDIASLMVDIKSSDKDTLGAAYDWMHSHEDVVAKWLPENK
jgi:glycine betaine/proline transport system substrate-binding protein